MGKTKFSSVAVGPDFNTEALHKEMQRLRQSGKDVTLKGYLSDTYDAEMTPERFYRDLGVDLRGMTVEKMLNTSELNKWLFPEIFRDAIRRGLEYTPFYGTLIAAEEQIDSTGITMPSIDYSGVTPDDVRLRDTHEGASITEGAEIITWSEKQVTIKKKARGLMQTYESIMFTPIDLAAIFFEELGTQLGADLDGDLIDIAFNGDQADGSGSAPVIGATTAGTLTYADLVRVWTRLRRINRVSSVMLCNEADAITILGLPEFQKSLQPNLVSSSGVTLNFENPLPTQQDIFVHSDVPAGKILFVDRARAFVQLTAMPLLIESERIVRRQIEGEYVSIITGFANIFRDGRLVLDYNTSLVVNPGPVVPVR